MTIFKAINAGLVLQICVTPINLQSMVSSSDEELIEVERSEQSEETTLMNLQRISFIPNEELEYISQEEVLEKLWLKVGHYSERVELEQQRNPEFYNYNIEVIGLMWLGKVLAGLIGKFPGLENVLTETFEDHKKQCFSEMLILLEEGANLNLSELQSMLLEEALTLYLFAECDEQVNKEFEWLLDYHDNNAMLAALSHIKIKKLFSFFEPGDEKIQPLLDILREFNPSDPLVLMYGKEPGAR